MNCPRHHFLAGPGFSADQYRAAPWADKLNDAESGAHGGAVPYQKLSPGGHGFTGLVQRRTQSHQLAAVSQLARPFNLTGYSLDIKRGTASRVADQNRGRGVD